MKDWPAPFSFDLIVADPPWAFETYSDEGQEKGPGAHYDCMSPEEIAESFRVDELAGSDCLLLCWATWPLLPRQIATVKAWRFEYKSVLVWKKTFFSGRSAIGTGYRVRSMCEPVILATIGNPSHRPLPGLFEGIRREHSRKPDEFYRLVEDRCPVLFRRLDLFARQSRPGWQAWGNEATKFDEVAA